MKCFALVAMAFAPSVLAVSLRSGSCAAEDLAVRATLQNKLADDCVEMCKELGAYPEKCKCPEYVDTTDKTPGVVTWEELLTYMGDVKLWGQDTLKGWQGMVS